MDFIEWIRNEKISIHRFAKEGGLAPSSLYSYSTGDRGMSKDMAQLVHKLTREEVSIHELLWPTFPKIKKRDKPGRPSHNKGKENA